MYTYIERWYGARLLANGKSECDLITVGKITYKIKLDRKQNTRFAQWLISIGVYNTTVAASSPSIVITKDGNQRFIIYWFFPPFPPPSLRVSQ